MSNFAANQPPKKGYKNSYLGRLFKMRGRTFDGYPNAGSMDFATPSLVYDNGSAKYQVVSNGKKEAVEAYEDQSYMKARYKRADKAFAVTYSRAITCQTAWMLKCQKKGPDGPGQLSVGFIASNIFERFGYPVWADFNSKFNCCTRIVKSSGVASWNPAGDVKGPTITVAADHAHNFTSQTFKANLGVYSSLCVRKGAWGKPGWIIHGAIQGNQQKALYTNILVEIDHGYKGAVFGVEAYPIEQRACLGGAVNWDKITVRSKINEKLHIAAAADYKVGGTVVTVGAMVDGKAGGCQRPGVGCKIKFNPWSPTGGKTKKPVADEYAALRW